MEANRRYSLSIAGFDPSAGAGLLADVKTFEQCGVYGLGVCTAITIQNDLEFNKVEWVSTDSILQQLHILLKRYPVEWVKVGLIKDLNTLQQIIAVLKKHNDHIKIIWDPIFKSSTGFSFHTEMDKSILKSISAQLYLITPNTDEILQMAESNSVEKAALVLSKYCAILLKGGHSGNEHQADDWLFVNGETELISGERVMGKTKHGTGCVLSSAITSFLAQGYSLSDSCSKAKGYITAFIASTDNLLGWHAYIINPERHA